ncbi:putative cytochrome bo terminal oxidase subunit I/cytochrome bo terminal oxidase subunit III fusion protein [Candidatus Zinderia insecticola CARI]|uniref:Putative cytochrome bo terminal oxidase subunit I/cytochrome bo terminal oxidase subunit III fusion protein n=1 Tax=Zinderia insecticola (strain CARI) TaxID=871271 RepID=E0TIN8_ZINIC|nr:putative cytochrome bo terminal oxidase subunit I/cytochrome bo terminal oxidase subunit III fusion protein [Candidatus Zinderia insecticola CARI]
MNIKKFFLGNLDERAIELKDPIIFWTFIILLIISTIIIYILIYYKLLKIIWKKWINTTNHKKIGIMYIILGIIMLLRGFIDALMMKIHQSISFGNSRGFLSPNHYNQIFTVHGVIMIFFVAMPIIIGIMNYIIPLQIGSKDLAFPFLNNLSFWMTTFAAFLIMISLFLGEFAKTGWLAYPPLSEISESPYVGVDYYIWSIQISGISTLISSINFIVTIIKLRIPNINFFNMPIFVWTTLCSNILIIISFPVLTSVLIMLSLDRIFGMHFFTNNLGGNSMMYINLIWIWGHPEVYILILPAFGIFSEITVTFCRKKLFGYYSMIFASLIITILSYIVWLHHFFTMGGGPNVNTFFGIATMIIAIPTGVKIFNWIFTMYYGKITFEIPMLWTLAFITTFSIGGMAGIILSIPPADYLLHNSLFLVAHFHTVIIGGVVFSIFAAINYWYPKVFGYRLNKFWGLCSFILWTFGFYITFIPIYILGFMGVTRRINHFNDLSLKIWFKISLFGTIIILLGIISFIIQIIVSYLYRNIEKKKIENYWKYSKTLEWNNLKNFKKYIKKENLLFKINKIKNNNIKKKTYNGFILSFLFMLLCFLIIWKIFFLFSIILLLTIFYIIYINIKKKKYKKEDIINNKFGIWLYLMSDVLMFSTFLTVYFVLGYNYIKINKIKNIFNIKIIFLNTLLLLFSSLFLYYSIYNFKIKNKFNILKFIILTIISSFLFIFIEYLEICNLLKNNIKPKNNVFFSCFFTIIFFHGIHVLIGIFILILIFLKILKFNINNENKNNLKYLSMYWNFLEIFWFIIFIFIYIFNLL